MATMTPDSTVIAVGYTLSGGATVHGVLDASTSSWLNVQELALSDGGFIVVTLSSPGAAANQLVECTLAMDADASAGDGQRLYVKSDNVTPSWIPPGGPWPNGWRIDSHGEAGAFTALYANPGYSASARLTVAQAEALQLRITALATSTNYIKANNLRVTTNLLTPHTTTLISPTGTITGNRPIVQWTSGAAAQAGWEVLIYAQSVYSSGGFAPGAAGYPAIASKIVTEPAPYSGGTTGFDVALTSWTVTKNLPIGVYRAYVRTADHLPAMLGEYLLWSDYTFQGFTVVDTPPVPEAPATPVHILSSLPRRERLWTSHEAVVQATLYSPLGDQHLMLDVIDGSVRYDATSKVRGQATLEVSNAELVPSGTVPFDPGQYLHPFGSYVHLARGIGDDLVGLGVFRIDQVRMSRGSTPPTVRISASDYGAHLDDARFTYARTRQDWTTGTAVPQLVTTVAQAIVNEAGLAIVLGSTSAATVAANYINEQGDNRLDALSDLAQQLGWTTFALDEAYGLGPAGAIYFGPDLTTTTAVASFVEGDNATLITNADYVLDRKDVYDLGIAYSPDGLYVAAAFDSNPVSPLRRGSGSLLTPVDGAGPFSPGGKPIFFSSPVVTSQPACDTAAQTVLESNTGLLQPVQLRGLVDPAVRPGMGVDLLLAGELDSTRMRVVQVVVPLGPTNEMTLTVTNLATFVTAAV